MSLTRTPEASASEMLACDTTLQCLQSKFKANSKQVRQKNIIEDSSNKKMSYYICASRHAVTRKQAEPFTHAITCKQNKMAENRGSCTCVSFKENVFAHNIARRTIAKTKGMQSSPEQVFKRGSQRQQWFPVPSSGDQQCLL